MKSNTFIVISFIILFCVPSQQALSQNGGGRGYQAKLERIKAQKVAFFTEHIGLTPAEAEKFWPVYNAYQAKKDQIALDRRKTLRAYHNDELSDREIGEIADKYIHYQVDEANLDQEYLTKFKKILPVKKVMDMYIAENQFKYYLLNQIRGRGPGHGWGPGPANQDDNNFR
ncbi:MAG TPA: hypothetical protein VE912_15090 [Bacteroidales bacterium]|nr:hypothetical protein [Bacteroidales bacterium]